MKKILVSACLCGVNCKYNGSNNLDIKLKKLYDEGKVIPLCPEELGGLKTPRVPSEIVNGTGDDVLLNGAKVVSKLGEDLTDAFKIGAFKTLKIAKENNIEVAILKSNSPSCGKGKIYNGTFSGELIEGNGVTAALLLEHKIKIFNEKNYKEGDELLNEL